MTQFILRFDDICPGMDWGRFAPFEAALKKLPGVLPVLGVVPDNRDPVLQVQSDAPDFWHRLREWQQRGWTIAQHGHTHEYTTRNGGLLGIYRDSEFAGLPFEIQLEKLSQGKRILEREGVWQPYFMAPSHSFDRETLRALRALGFAAVTDGWGIYPYELEGLTAVPQLFSTPKHFGIGVYTIAMHTNSMSNAAIAAMLRFVENNAPRIVSFPDAMGLARRNVGAVISRSVTRTVLTAARRLRAAASQ